MKMINRTGRVLPVRKELMVGSTGVESFIMLPPWDEQKPDDHVVNVKDGYAHPRRSANGGRIPSIAEQTTPGLVPLDSDEHEQWKRPPARDWSPKPATPDASFYTNLGMPPGQAQMMADQAAAAANAPSQAFSQLVEQVGRLTGVVDQLTETNKELRVKLARLEGKKPKDD